MSESFLHYLWQFQYFNKSNLQTTQGEPIHIFSTGSKNSNAGPDFFNARVKIGDMEWVGSVEIHIEASGWFEHKHNLDSAYENVILHVVWKDDKPVEHSDKSTLPTLELKDKVDEKLLWSYKKLINNPERIHCASSLASVNTITKFSMLDKALLQRLKSKSDLVNEMQQHNTNDWEETCYQLLCKNFGFNVNAEPFLQLARTLPYKILMKHADKVLQLEAFLFGQAGFLDESNDDIYYQLLKREYSLLSQKYQLTERKLNKSQWKFLRLRPANFPTIRLAQLAMLIHNQKNIFSKIIEKKTLKELKDIFNVRQSEYWLRHFQFFKPSKEGAATLGESSIDNIIINTVVPVLAAYSHAKDEPLFIDRAIEILQNLPTENNAITREWASVGWRSATAFDSQALIELYNNFCLRRKCLECAIGSTLIKPQSR